MDLGFLKIIAKILGDEGNQIEEVKRAAAYNRMLSSFLLILLGAFSRNPWYVTGILAGLLCYIAMQNPKKIARILGPVAGSVGITVIFLLPAAFMGSPRSLTLVTMKVAQTVTVLSILRCDTRWKEMTAALSNLHVPDLFILILDTTIRFLVILGRYAIGIGEAVGLRRVGRRNWKNAGTAGILGVTWIKSQQMADETAQAMMCRCFNGSYKVRRRHRWNIRDTGMLLLDALVVLVFVCLERDLK
ncbi:MAG: energy-coupling factor transporter transmembrane protein EcfT [Lachnospiraceae bacterium]|nr:energy-coupling factor transporter transmembrane protein EcfT [Lachnospiraceae bacterium]